MKTVIIALVSLVVTTSAVASERVLNVYNTCTTNPRENIKLSELQVDALKQNLVDDGLFGYELHMSEKALKEKKVNKEEVLYVGPDEVSDKQEELAAAKIKGVNDQPHEGHKPRVQQA